MEKKISIVCLNDFKYKIILIFLLLFIPRLIYILLFDNFSTDSFNYLRIADNISKGCGFAFTNHIGECETIVGTAFPGYHFFIFFFKVYRF